MYIFDNVKKTYDGKVVLDIEHIEFCEKKIYAIVGENGSGKSTFAKIISGIEKSDNKISNKYRIGYMPQKPYIFDMSLEKNIRLGNSVSENKINEIIKDLDIEYLKGKNSKKFSGGEQQKVALARLLIDDYDIVVLDEPTSAMDEKSVIRSEEIIKKYLKNKTIIIITHNMEQAKRMGVDIIKFSKGKILNNGTS